jgi:hypothetical protein
MVLYAIIIVLFICSSLVVKRVVPSHIWCRHTFGTWSGWSLTRPKYDNVEFVRYRACTKCGNLERRLVGNHYCNDRTCVHFSVFKESFESGSRVAQLEKELGI